MATFTLEEFIAQHKLNVPLTDSHATRMIAKRLRELGFQQVRMVYKDKRQPVWTNERATQLDDLKSKLASLKL